MPPASETSLAEREGFEPSRRFCRPHDFQSCSFGQLGHLSAGIMLRLISRFVNPFLHHIRADGVLPERGLPPEGRLLDLRGTGIRRDLVRQAIVVYKVHHEIHCIIVNDLEVVLVRDPQGRL